MTNKIEFTYSPSYSPETNVVLETELSKLQLESALEIDELIHSKEFMKLFWLGSNVFRNYFTDVNVPSGQDLAQNLNHLNAEFEKGYDFFTDDFNRLCVEEQFPDSVKLVDRLVDLYSKILD